jgi:hypothetical protein
MGRSPFIKRIKFGGAVGHRFSPDIFTKGAAAKHKAAAPGLFLPDVFTAAGTTPGGRLNPRLKTARQGTEAVPVKKRRLFCIKIITESFIYL